MIEYTTLHYTILIIRNSLKRKWLVFLGRDRVPNSNPTRTRQMKWESKEASRSCGPALSQEGGCYLTRLLPQWGLRPKGVRAPEFFKSS